MAKRPPSIKKSNRAPRKQQVSKNAILVLLRGGPRDGERIQLTKYAPNRIRFAWPEWCNYYRVGDSLVYEYDNERPWVSPRALSE